jgi:Protein of unknown function (DUF2628)
MIALLLRARDAKHVAVYTIHEGPTPPLDRIDRAEALEFVRDGFTGSVAAFPPLYFVTNKMWVELLAYVAAVVAGVGILSMLSVSPALILVLLLAGHVWLAYEAVDLRRDAMARAGWQTLGSVSGRNLAECEHRFFDMWLAGENATVAQSENDVPPASWIGTVEQHFAGLFSGSTRA